MFLTKWQLKLCRRAKRSEPADRRRGAGAAGGLPQVGGGSEGGGSRTLSRRPGETLLWTACRTMERRGGSVRQGVSSPLRLSGMCGRTRSGLPDIRIPPWRWGFRVGAEPPGIADTGGRGATAEDAPRPVPRCPVGSLTCGVCAANKPGSHAPQWQGAARCTLGTPLSSHWESATGFAGSCLPGVLTIPLSSAGRALRGLRRVYLAMPPMRSRTGCARPQGGHFRLADLDA